VLDNTRAPGSKKTFLWGGLLVVGLTLVGAGVWFGLTQLDTADKWGSVIGSLVALIGLPLTIYGVVLARRSSTQATSGASQVQTVTGSGIAGSVTQIHGVSGSVSVGLPFAAAPPPSAPAISPPASAEDRGRSVSGSSEFGPVRRPGDVTGDVGIDR